MEKIIEGALQGDRECLTKIYNDYKKQIYYFCLKLLGSSSLAQQLCSETFQCAYERLETLENPDSFLVWIKNIAAIKCFNYIHKIKPMLFLKVSETEIKNLFTPAEVSRIEKGDKDEIKTAAIMDKMLDRLDDAQRMTIMLHYYNTLSINQISKIMSCPIEDVKARLKDSADRMKLTLTVLSENGISCSSVDFRSALQLVSALINVPPLLDSIISTEISRFLENKQRIENEKHAELRSLVEQATEKYIKDNMTGELEIASIPDDDEEYPPETPLDDEYSISDAIKPNEKIVSLNIPAPVEETAPETDKKPFPVKIVAVAVAAVIVIVGLIVLLSRCSGGEEKTENKTAAASSKVTSEVKPAEPLDVFTVETAVDSASVKADDGTEIATASYQYPKLTMSEYPQAAEKINHFFDSEKATVLATYEDENKREECIVKYTHKSFGDWKKDEYKVTLTPLRCDDSVICFEKKTFTFTYGNLHGDENVELYCFSTATGDRLTVSDIAENLSDFTYFASQYINGVLVDKQASGDYPLYPGYENTVSETLQKEGRISLTDTGVAVSFDADEVAYYTYGLLKIEIPYYEVNSYLKETYRK